MIDMLFVVHGVCVLVSGAAAWLYPAFYHMFMNSQHVSNATTILVDDVVALYGALIFGQGFITLSVATLGDGKAASIELKKALSWTYAVVFGLTFCTNATSHFREPHDWNDLNVANILLFGFLFLAYSICTVQLTFLPQSQLIQSDISSKSKLRHA